MTGEEAVRAASEIVMSHGDSVYVLLGDVPDASRRDALADLITAAYSVGYQRGLRRGGKAMAAAVVERLADVEGSPHP